MSCPVRGKPVLAAMGLLVLAASPCAGDAHPLTLAEAFERALSRNPNLAVSRIDPRIARARTRIERGPFDPEISLDIQRNDQKNPTASQLSGANVAESDTRFANLGLRSKLEDGTQLDAKFNNQRSETNSRFNTLNPNYTSSLVLTITRPILQGAGTDVNRTRLTVARNEEVKATLGWIRTAQDTVVAVEKAYWELIFTGRNIQVQDRSVEGARSLLEYNRRRQEIGAGSEVETLEAEAVLAARLEERLSAVRLHQDAHTTLKFLLGLAGEAEWTLEPVDEPRDLADVPPIGETIRQAIRRRAEYLQGEIDLENRRIELGFLANQRKSQFDLVGSYTRSGLGATLERAHDQVFEGDFPSWALGVTWKLPVANHKDLGELERGRLEVARAEGNLTVVGDQIAREVSNAVQAVQTDLERVGAAGRAEELAARKLEAEETRYQQGLISNFDLLRFQEDLARARSRAVRARTDLLKSRADLDRATGEILDRRDIKVDVQDLRLTP